MATHTAYTAVLDDEWDLMLDSNGNIKTITESDAVIQNVCNECRLFYNDAYFRADEGINYFVTELGQPLDKALLSYQFRTAIENVSGVSSINSIEIDDLDKETRKVTGTISVITEFGDYVRVTI